LKYQACKLVACQCDFDQFKSVKIIIKSRPNSGCGWVIADVKTEKTSEQIDLRCSADSSEPSSYVKVNLAGGFKTSQSTP
jgi:hypothetical protein